MRTLKKNFDSIYFYEIYFLTKFRQNVNSKKFEIFCFLRKSQRFFYVHRICFAIFSFHFCKIIDDLFKLNIKM